MPKEPAPQNLRSFAEKNFRPLVLVLSGLFLFGGGMFLAKGWRLRSPPPITYEVSDESSEKVSTEKESSSKETSLIKVDVSGAVMSPGVYELSGGARVEDAIKQSGGFSDEADQEWVSKNLNLAVRLSDGEKIYIPEKGEVAGAVAGGYVVGGEGGGAPSSAVQKPVTGKININTASQTELESLTGIGPVKAQAIIAYRSSKPFDSVEEIMEVKGIAEGTFEKIKDRIVVR